MCLGAEGIVKGEICNDDWTVNGKETRNLFTSVGIGRHLLLNTALWSSPSFSGYEC